jgi:hypothetical protein
MEYSGKNIKFKSYIAVPEIFHEYKMWRFIPINTKIQH